MSQRVDKHERAERLQLFEQVVQLAQRRPMSSMESMFPSGMIMWVPDDFTRSIAISWRGQVVEWRDDGVDAVDALAASLRENPRIARSVLHHEIRHHVLLAAAKVLDGGATGEEALSRLVSDLPRQLGDSLVILPIGGIEWMGPPRALSAKVVVGRLGDAMEAEIAELVRRLRLNRVRFRFPETDVAWTEDLEFQRNDPEGAQGQDLRFPVLLAVHTEGTGATAYLRAEQIAEGILGATWVLAQQGYRIPRWPPWLLGDPNVSGSDDLNMAEIGTLGGMEPLQVNRLYSRVDYARTEGLGEDMPMESLMDGLSGSLLSVVARAGFMGPTTPERRLAVACRRVLRAARQMDPSERLPQFTLALEGLVIASDSSTGAAEQFRTRVSQLLVSAGPAQAHHTEILGHIYSQRSRIVHEGLSQLSYDELFQLAHDAETYCCRSVKRVAELVSQGTISTDGQMEQWLGRHE